jgi:hypothetical protein
MKKKLIGHKFSKGDVSLETDYLNGKIYLDINIDDVDISGFEDMIEILSEATKEMRKRGF